MRQGGSFYSRKEEWKAWKEISSMLFEGGASGFE